MLGLYVVCGKWQRRWRTGDYQCLYGRIYSFLLRGRMRRGRRGMLGLPLCTTLPVPSKAVATPQRLASPIRPLCSLLTRLSDLDDRNLMRNSSASRTPLPLCLGRTSRACWTDITLCSWATGLLLCVLRVSSTRSTLCEAKLLSS